MAERWTQCQMSEKNDAQLFGNYRWTRFELDLHLGFVDL